MGSVKATIVFKVVLTECVFLYSLRPLIKISKVQKIVFIFQSFQFLGTNFPTGSAPELYERHSVVRELLFVYLVSNQFQPRYFYS